MLWKRRSLARANHAEQLKLFEINANRIRHLLGTGKGKGAGALEVTLAATSERATPDEIVASVRSKLLEVLGTAAAVEHYIVDAASGRVTKTDPSTPPGQALLKQHVIEELKLDKEEIRKRPGEAQAILPGYVVQNEVKPDFAYWLALRRDDFVLLHRKMSELCDALGSLTLDRDHIRDTMIAVVRAVTYEDIGDERLADYFKRILGVPKAALSDIMRYTIVGFADSFVKSDAAVQGRYRAQICAKQKMLEVMNSGRRVKLSDIEWRDGRPSIAKTAEQEPFNWDWSTGTGLKYYFIPLELLP